jgi:hypothetical protein
MAWSVTKVSRPRLIMYKPVAPNGTAVLVIGGGGYAHIAAFELVYRLPQEEWTPAAPFQDAQRAMRFIRDRSGSLDPARIGVIGFSAGAHLAGMTAAKPAHALYSPVDSSNAIAARPDFAALIYPVLTTLPPFDKTHARREILGANASDARAIAYSVERQVDQQTPRTFLAQALDDPISPIDNSLLMLSAPASQHSERTARLPVRRAWLGTGLAQLSRPPVAGPVHHVGGAERILEMNSESRGEQTSDFASARLACCHRNVIGFGLSGRRWLRDRSRSRLYASSGDRRFAA